MTLCQQQPVVPGMLICIGKTRATVRAAFALCCSPGKIWERGAALTSRLQQSFETEVLTQEENLAGSILLEYIADA